MYLIKQERIDRVDRAIATFMERFGHAAHRLTLGGVFIWFGLLKQFGVETATSLLARTIYFGSPEFMVPILGWWEVAIGVTLIVRPLVRIALLLLIIRLPGTFLALVLLPDICFTSVPWAPTVEGQYLVKDMMLFGAALVIGGTVRANAPRGHYH